MKWALSETTRRRVIQDAYNAEHGITPEGIRKNIGNLMSSVYEMDYVAVPELRGRDDRPEDRFRTVDELEKEIKALEKEMRSLAKALDFEKAAEVRDRIKRLRQSEFGLQ